MSPDGRVPRDLTILAPEVRDPLTSYVDERDEVRRATAEELVAGLRALGVPVGGPRDVASAAAERERAAWERVVEPVLLAWEGRIGEFEVRLPARLREAELRIDLAPAEDDDDRGPADGAGPWSLTVPTEDSPVVRAADPGGRAFVARRVRIRRRLPLGYHRLEVSVGAGRALVGGGSTVIAAPRRAPGEPGRRDWGVFLPLHALHSRRSWGVGDLTDLEALMSWARGLGGSVVATLPLLAQFLHTFHEPSPYSPASKLFWNELYADPTRLPEAAAEPVRSLLGSAGFHSEVRRLRGGRLVDHDGAFMLKRRVLEACLGALDGLPERRDAFERHLRDRPLLREYARFRAVCERRDRWWGEWPARMRGSRDQPGVLRAADGDRAAERSHAYAQWVTEGQVAAVGGRDLAGDGLYLDMPLGVNPAGFDAWRFPGTFALGARGGAPPDRFFTRGQDWGFPPPHPEWIRQDGHGYLRRTLRHVLRHAGILRIDHVMGLYRLYWIPKGMDARTGVYVRYPAEEQFAVLALETHRTGTQVVGEDLGTVPDQIHPLMDGHNVRRSYVVQFSVLPDPGDPLLPPPPGGLASLNTHDMPPFAAFWRAMDVDDRAAMGLLDPDEAERERKERALVREAVVGWLVEQGWVEPAAEGADLMDEEAVRRAMEGCLAALAAGGAGVVVANLEDLWGETLPQNVPGTSTERPNWKRRSRYGLERMRTHPEVLRVLGMVDRLRKEGDRA